METIERAPATGVEIRIDRALMAASIACPGCGMFCRCTGYVPGELALFECRGCATRYYVGLGLQPVLRAESTAAVTP